MSFPPAIVIAVLLPHPRGAGTRSGAAVVVYLMRSDLG